MLMERLGLKATALAISVLLWLVVSASRQAEMYVSVAVLPELDSSLVLVHKPPPLRALVAGRTADLMKLYANPPAVRHVVDRKAADTLVLDVAAGDVRIPSELRDVVRVLDVQPRRVTLRFEARAAAGPAHTPAP
jgi:hypothetical protein